MTPEARWQAQLLELIAQQEQLADASLGLNAAGLAVYRNNYRVGLIETLKMIYPVCGQIVGEEFSPGWHGSTANAMPRTAAICIVMAAALVISCRISHPHSNCPIWRM
jgi:hypothetical protein